MSVSAIFALLVKLATVAPQLWPHVVAAFEALEDLTDGLMEAVSAEPPAVPRVANDEQEAINARIAELEAILPDSRAKGQFLLKLAGFLGKHPALAQGFATLIGGLLAGK